MIRREWREPNYAWQALDADNKPREGITYSASDEELVERLEQRGFEDISVNAYDFNEWRKEAAAALLDLQSGPPYKFDAGVWRKLKGHLFDLFDGKCAYCESSPLPTEPGDVEHFRPKRTPTEDKEHPGYWWLAYDPTNLLPSCKNCNMFEGKVSQFPIDGPRVSAPGPLHDEQPCLIHPFDDEPDKYLKFNFTGKVAALNDRGDCSRKVYRLNRGYLVKARGLAVQDVEVELGTKIIQLRSVEMALEALRTEYRRHEYGAAKLDCLDAALKPIARALDPE